MDQTWMVTERWNVGAFQLAPNIESCIARCSDPSNIACDTTFCESRCTGWWDSTTCE